MGVWGTVASIHLLTQGVGLEDRLLTRPTLVRSLGDCSAWPSTVQKVHKDAQTPALWQGWRACWAPAMQLRRKGDHAPHVSDAAQLLRLAPEGHEALCSDT